MWTPDHYISMEWLSHPHAAGFSAWICWLLRLICFCFLTLGHAGFRATERNVWQQQLGTNGKREHGHSSFSSRTHVRPEHAAVIFFPHWFKNQRKWVRRWRQFKRNTGVGFANTFKRINAFNNASASCHVFISFLFFLIIKEINDR